VLLRKKGRSPGGLLRGDEVSTTSRVAVKSVRLEIGPRLPIRYKRVETWRLSMNYAIGVATQYDTASEAAGCRRSIITRTLKTVVECRHPVASLAVLYWVAIMLASFLTRLKLFGVLQFQEQVGLCRWLELRLPRVKQSPHHIFN